MTELGNPGDLSFTLWKGFLVFASNQIVKADISFNLDEEAMDSRADSREEQSKLNVRFILNSNYKLSKSVSLRSKVSIMMEYRFVSNLGANHRFLSSTNWVELPYVCVKHYLKSKE